MYKAMIIDDERWVLNSLLKSIDWTSEGFEIIGTETESPKALDRIQAQHPDLVFVDIRMPEINGLELIKICNDLQLDTLFIVVSGFAEFSYVKKCINLGAIGYCLKPIEEEEMLPLLKKARELLQDRAAKDVPTALDWFMEESPEGLARIGRSLELAGMEVNKGARVVFGLEFNGAELARRYAHLKISSEKNKCIYLVQEDSRTPIREWLLLHAGEYAGIGLSRLFHSLQEVYSALEEAEMAAYQYFMVGRPTIYQVGAIKGFSEFKPLSAALQRNDMTELQTLYRQYGEWFKTGEYQIQHAFYLYNTVMTVILQSRHSDTENLGKYLMIDFVRLIERYQSMEEMLQDLQRMTIAYLGGMYDQKQIRSAGFLEILHYVNKNYARNLSLQLLASEFYLNRNYISQLFIKHVGQSFTDYVAELRIRHACELLKSSNAPIHRVGERVGYPDAYYFSKIFKKVMKQTPREYRSSQ